MGEISCPTKYFKEASSIDFLSSIKYGMGVLVTSIKFRLKKWRIADFDIFKKDDGKDIKGYYKTINR